MSQLILGVDGGGRKTIAIQVDRSGHVVRISRCGGINPQDKPDRQSEFSTLIQSDSESLEHLAFGCIGAPGYGEVPSISAIPDAFFSEIAACRMRGEEVKLSGFGSFETRDKVERPGRNPLTGEVVMVTARRVVAFRPSRDLKLVAGTRKMHQTAWIRAPRHLTPSAKARATRDGS